jgi:hypothetical protein
MRLHVTRRLIWDGLPWAIFVAFLAFTVAGCVSTKDRYTKAQELAQDERYAEAARSYVRVLRDEPDWPHARAELAAVGQRGADRLLEEAERAAAGGRYPSAVAALDALDALRADTESVGVSLAVPADYDTFRRETVRAAADQVIDEGRRAEEAGDWRAAIDAYERARQYVQRAERLSMLDAAQARVSLRWAEDDMARGHFRAAHERAAFVYDLVGAEHQWAREAEALQQVAIDRGTRVVAFLPVGRTRGPTAALPRFFRSELNAVLQYDYWSTPPLFIAPVDPIETRRGLRRAGTGRAVLSDTDAADVGRSLGADFVVVGELTRFERIEDDVEETVRAVQMRVRDDDGQGQAGRGATERSVVWRDTSYVLQTFDLALEATVEYRIVDVYTGRAVDHDSERVRHEGRRQRGLFPGDYRDLDLSGAELSLFDRDDQQAAERAIENQLIDRLAEELADGVFYRLLRRID